MDNQIPVPATAIVEAVKPTTVISLVPSSVNDKGTHWNNRLTCGKSKNGYHKFILAGAQTWSSHWAGSTFLCSRCAQIMHMGEAVEANLANHDGMYKPQDNA
jgi:hypothetical protein